VKLELDLRSDRLAPGDVVAGQVAVVEGGSARSLVLTLGFHERTTWYMATPFSTSMPLAEGDLSAGQAIEFSFTLPADAPPSVKTEHSELLWEIEVSVDRPGLDTQAARRVEVVARSSSRWEP
jgi:hypothetical protein